MINRLTSAASGTGGYGSYSWTYDKLGNRLTQTVGSATTTYGYPRATNRLASITVGGTTTPVSTNANGNIISIPPANSSTAATFAYLVTNRLGSVTGSPTAATFVYNDWGQRFTKTDSGGSPTYYIYGQDGALLEETDSGLTDYIYVNGRPIGTFVPALLGGGGTVYYLHTDRQGTPQLATDPSQTVVWGTQYQPFGTTTIPIGPINQNMRFPGQYFDGETGSQLQHQPRLYAQPRALPGGRSYWALGGTNPYVYANANPGGFIDTLGLQVFIGFPTPIGGGQYSAPKVVPPPPTPPSPTLADILNGISVVSGGIALGSAAVGAEPVAAVAVPISLCTGVLGELLDPHPLAFSLESAATYFGNAVNAPEAAKTYIEGAVFALKLILH